MQALIDRIILLGAALVGFSVLDLALWWFGGPPLLRLITLWTMGWLSFLLGVTMIHYQVLRWLERRQSRWQEETSALPPESQ